MRPRLKKKRSDAPSGVDHPHYRPGSAPAAAITGALQPLEFRPPHRRGQPGSPMHRLDAWPSRISAPGLREGTCRRWRQRNFVNTFVGSRGMVLARVPRGAGHSLMSAQTPGVSRRSAIPKGNGAPDPSSAFGARIWKNVAATDQLGLPTSAQNRAPGMSCSSRAWMSCLAPRRPAPHAGAKNCARRPVFFDRILRFLTSRFAAQVFVAPFD